MCSFSWDIHVPPAETDHTFDCGVYSANTNKQKKSFSAQKYFEVKKETRWGQYKNSAVCLKDVIVHANVAHM